MARKLAPKLTVVYRHLVKGSSFPECSRLADVVPVPKGSPSTDVGDYRPMSITPLLSKVFKKFVAGKLIDFLESYSLHLHFQFLYRRGVATCDALLAFSHHL